MLTANDIDFGRIKYETARRTSEEAFGRELTEKSRPQKNDLLLTKDGTLGRVALHDGQPACINQSVALVRFDETKVIPRFILFALMSTGYQEMMLFDAGGTTIKHIYITKLAKMPIAFPSLEQQKEIVTRLTPWTLQFQRLIDLNRLAIDRLQEYRSTLITNAVTGRIDVRDFANKEAAA